MEINNTETESVYLNQIKTGSHISSHANEKTNSLIAKKLNLQNLYKLPLPACYLSLSLSLLLLSSFLLSSLLSPLFSLLQFLLGGFRGKAKLKWRRASGSWTVHTSWGETRFSLGSTIAFTSISLASKRLSSLHVTLSLLCFIIDEPTLVSNAVFFSFCISFVISAG